MDVEEEERGVGVGEVGDGVEFVVLEQPQWQNAGSGVSGEDLTGGRVGVFEDGCGGGELGGEMGSKIGSCTVAEDDEIAWGDVAGVGEVRPGGDGVFSREAFGRMGAGGVAESAVVEGENVDAEPVEGQERGDTVGEGAAGAVEIEDRGCYVFRSWFRGDPPAVELG